MVEEAVDHRGGDVLAAFRGNRRGDEGTRLSLPRCIKAGCAALSSFPPPKSGHIYVLRGAAQKLPTALLWGQKGINEGGFVEYVDNLPHCRPGDIVRVKPVDRDTYELVLRAGQDKTRTTISAQQLALLIHNKQLLPLDERPRPHSGGEKTRGKS